MSHPLAALVACFLAAGSCAVVLDVTGPPYFAKGDNHTVNTRSLQSAINDAAALGGGRVLLPPSGGTFLSGAVFLLSNVELYIASGSVLQAVAPEAWEKSDSTAAENESTWFHFPEVYTPDLQQDLGGFQHAALINGGFCEQVSGVPYAYGDQCLRWRKLRNVTVRGEGPDSIVDGGGWLWWKLCGYVVGQSGDGAGRCPDQAQQASQRPKLMHLMWVEGLTILGLWARNPAFFAIVPQYSKDVLVSDVMITAPASNEDFPGRDIVFPSHNTDGVNIESCRNVLLQRLFIDNGDDCVAIYSGSNLQGRVVNQTTQGVHVRDVHCGHGHGFAIGSRTAAGISDVLFENVACVGSWKCVRFKSCRGRGGLVTNVTFQGVRASNVQYAVHADLLYKDLPPTNRSATPVFERLTIRDMRAEGTRAGVLVRGLPEAPLDLAMDNVVVETQGDSFTCDDAVCHLHNVKVLPVHSSGGEGQQRLLPSSVMFA